MSGLLYIGKVSDKSKQPCESVFRLAGRSEDALTYALGYLLARDAQFCLDFLRQCGAVGTKLDRQLSGLLDDSKYEIHLQEVTDREVGRRDIVIEVGSMIRAVIEAKIGRARPAKEQILKYADDEDDWKSIDPTSGHRALITLTRDELAARTKGAARRALRKRGITLYEARWYQVYSLVQEYRRRSESIAMQWMFDEFIRFFRRDYEMKYYDAEVAIQDVDNLNAEIFDKGWMYVTSERDKAAPLYFAPYLTRTRRTEAQYESKYYGILQVGRVLRVEDLSVGNLVKTELASILKADDVHRAKWEYGLSLIKKRARQEQWKVTNINRLYFLDKPFKIRRLPLTKAAKQPIIPSQIPNGFSLTFEHLLR